MLEFDNVKIIEDQICIFTDFICSSKEKRNHYLLHILHQGFKRSLRLFTRKIFIFYSFSPSILCVESKWMLPEKCKLLYQ